MKTMTFFNNKGGVGKTSLVYHLAWMYADNGVTTLAVDLDPQANLTAMFLEEQRLEELWSGDEHPQTVYGAVRPILRGTGDIAAPHVELITDHLRLLPGDLALSRFEDKLSAAWPQCHNRDEASFRIMSAFHRLIEAAADWGPDIVLIDVGPNLGAINRAALIASELVCIPLAADLFSLQGLKNLGPTLQEWRTSWTDLQTKAPAALSLPKGTMEPVGYILLQHSVWDKRPVKAYLRWMNQIPTVYRESVLDQALVDVPSVNDDPQCLSRLKHYRSLMPMAMEANKPMFFLKPADGAIGAHTYAVQRCYDDFKALAGRIAKPTGVSLPALSPH